MIRTTLLALIVAVPIASPAVRAEDDPRALLDRINSATLDVDRSVEVRDLEIDLGLGSLEIVEGRLFPASPIAGQAREVVFIGDASFSIEPPDPIEASQLELFTRQESLTAEVRKAILVMGSPSVSRTLLDRPSGEPSDDTRLAEAREAFEAWISGAERRGFGADAAILNAALGDSAYQRYFTVLMHSEEYGAFYYLLDPSEAEQVTLGQFVPDELDDREKDRAERAIRRQQRRGRQIQTRLEDLGQWDTWLQSSLRDEHGAPLPGSTGFEPRSYTLDVTVDPAELRIDATAAIDLLAQVGGRRGLTFQLFEDLEPTAVRDEEGRDLLWLRSGRDLHVVLGDPVEAGSDLRIEIEYGGVIFDRLEKGIFRMRDTYAWYPHAGTIDRASYRTTLRYPRKLQLLSSGRRIDDRIESSQRVETRVLDLPVFAFGFEIGDFDVIKKRVGHVDLTIGFSKSTMTKDTGVTPEVVETLEKALLFYEEKFGVYPLDHLTVATIPRGFSQGYLGFLTLSHYLIALPKNAWVVTEGDGADFREVQRTETISHELAHQWWGNKLGWSGYRDQWLSEALADYSSVLFTRNRAGSGAVYLARHATDWKNSLSRATKEGRLVESIGPVVLGQRLVSSMSRTAYQAIVYDKGSVVFAMLARAFGEEPFTAMLRTLADHVENRAISTETFLDSLEHMSGLDLQLFADRYVYGTGIPEVYYRYRFVPGEDGQWSIEGEARQVSSANHRYKLYRTGSGGWDVSRERAEHVDVSESAFVVPFQIVLEVPESETQKKKGIFRPRYETGRGLGGNMVIRGERSEFALRIPQRPRDFYLDQRGEALAYFFCESRAPKRMLRYRAMELEGDEAEAMYREALRAALYSELALGQMEVKEKQLEMEARLEDARIHLHLTRLYLDQQRDADAQTEFEAAEQLFDKFDKHRYRATRDILESRLETRRGDHRRAYDRLSKALRLRFPRTSTDALAENVRRNKWRSGRTGDGEDYAILAVSAFETGHEIVARRAMEEAEERGADMGALREQLGS